MPVSGTSVPSPIAGIPSPYGPGLPIGGNYGAILTYFVNRGRPTYCFFGMPPSMAVVGVEAFMGGLLSVLPMVYLFLDQSMVAESWYYVYRYLLQPFGTTLSPPANTGPVSGSPGPLTLISSNVMGLPNNGFFCPAVLPDSSGAVPLGVSKSSLSSVYKMGNPLLVQISLGQAPLIRTKPKTTWP